MGLLDHFGQTAVEAEAGTYRPVVNLGDQVGLVLTDGLQRDCLRPTQMGQLFAQWLAST